MKKFASDIINQKYAHNLPNGKETWTDISWRVPRSVLSVVNVPESVVEALARAIEARKFLPGGRYLYAAGRSFHQVQNCVLNDVEDSREGWSEDMRKASMSLMTGAGIGCVYSKIREEGALIRRTGGTSTGPIALMNMKNEAGRWIMQGGSRRSAIWAGLHWDHRDIFRFIHIKDWPKEVRELKAKDFNFPAPMDMTNVSVILDDAFFHAYFNPKHELHMHAHKVYWDTIRQMLKTGEPGFSIDCGKNAGEHLRNACTEITSKDTDDICNLGSLNLARINSLEEMQELTELATILLLAGTVYSDVPYEEIKKTRDKNRRLGLGLMGVHEFLLTRGKKYGPDAELQKYLEIYAQSTEVAWKWADRWSISRPVKTRAIAPTGTIGIVAETTTAGEPLFCAAKKRRYLDGKTWKYQYVIDPIAEALVEKGIKPEDIEDAYSLANDVERRISFQAWLQGYVDHAISSTINLPAWGSAANNEDKVKEFGETLLKYLPKLRGVTAYPDGARGGQPLISVPYEEAKKQVGQVFYESTDVCDITKGGSCGS